MTWTLVSWGLVGMILLCLAVAAVTDLADRIIPNRVVLVVLCCGFGLRLMAGPGPLLASVLGAVTVLAVLSLPASYDFLGWGDVKLIVAVTFAQPAERLIALLLAVVLAGGLLSCLYLAVRFVLRRMAARLDLATPQAGRGGAVRRLARQEGARMLANEPMPYAIAILGGVACCLATA